MQLMQGERKRRLGIPLKTAEKEEEKAFMNLCTYKVIGKTLVVYINGELDLTTAPEFRTGIDNALEAHQEVKNLVLAFRKVRFIDSSGMGVIMGRYKTIKERGGHLICCDLTPQLRRILELSGLERIIRLCGTLDEALENL